MGGINIYQYAPNPIEWIDPYGLSACPIKVAIVRYKKDKVTPLAGSYTSGVNRAWALEKQLVTLTGYGTTNWTEAQKTELKTTGKVKGYTGHHINNAASAPEWEGDPRNIVFLTNSPNGGEHKNGLQGHRNSQTETTGKWTNPTTGRLIDRAEMMRQYNLAKDKMDKKGCKL